jgi:hypothetical protein
MPDVNQDYATERHYRALAPQSLAELVREPPLVKGKQ